MDFIEQLPASENSSTILVVIDCLTKQAIFIPSHDTMNTPQVAQLFLTHVFSKHGVPLHVTLDRGLEFISHFFCSLGKLLRMRLHFTLGYHPEGDGQMECANQVLEQYLCVYTNYHQYNQATITESLKKEPGPIRNDRKPRHPLCRPPSPMPVLLCPPSLSCITTGPCTTQPIPSLPTAATTATTD